MTDEPSMTDGSTGTLGGGHGCQELCREFIQGLPITGVSIVMLDTTGGQSTISASNDLALRIDTLQFDLGEGPRWETMRTGDPVLAGSLVGAAVVGWPIFAATVLGWGVEAVFAFPMRLGAITVGVVDLYSVHQGDLDDHDVALATSLTTRITPRAMQLALRAAETEGSDSEPIPMMRREVHQATGILLVQLETSATEAFLRLRAHAFSTGRTVQDVAHDVVSGALDFRLLSD